VVAACNPGGDDDATPLTTMAAPSTTAAPTTTTAPDYHQPPPWLDPGEWTGDELAALSAYAWAEWSALKASELPVDPDLPAFVATHNAEMLDIRQGAIRNDQQQNRAIKLRDVFRITPTDVKRASLTEMWIVACMTTNQVLYTIGTDPPDGPTHSYLHKAIMDLEGGQWVIADQAPAHGEDDYLGKTSCTA
jgi:hypothetical protein